MKKYNKILSLLLTFAMVLSMLPASAMAVVNEQSAKPSDKYVEGMPAGNRDLMASLRENYPEKAGENDFTVSETNDITVTETKNPSVTLDKGNAADQMVASHKQNEIVRVIVVLQGAALLEQGYSTDEIAANGSDVKYQVNIMHTMQDALVGDINVLVQSVMPEAYNGEIEAKYNYSVTMNGVAVEVPFGVVDEIAELDGVEAAYVAPQYTVPEDMTAGDAQPTMVTTQKLAGSALAWDAGYTGAGMRVAIIDTGLDIDHPSFVDAVPLTDTSLTIEEIASVLENLNAYKQYAGLTAQALYNSVKIPFRFNYVDQDLDVTHDNDGAGDHGTHVAGIATANKIETSDVVGVAPEAQVIVMKVFGKNGGAYWDDIVAAIEDCYWLNVDSINMSLGSPSGFTWESDDLSVSFQNLMMQIEQSDMIASVSAGNSYSAGCSNYWYEFMMAYGLQSYFPELVPGHNQTMDPADGVVSSPATFIGSTVVASLENNTTAAEVLVAKDENGGEDFIFVFGDNYTYFTFYLGGNGDFQDHEYEYVVVPGLGAASDYEGLDVTGKVALVQRGTLAFTDKQINAANAGAVGIIVYDNVDADLFYMQDAGAIPNVTVTRADGLKLIELAGSDGVGTLVVRYNNVIIAENALAGTMSDFSSWGVTPDLRLVPDITSYGGNIYSTYTDGEYGIMSGTSMSAPHIAGMSALVLQYLRGSDYAVLKSEADYHLVAEALLMSTAEPVRQPNGNYYSPRKQGAGNANIYSAISSPVYLTANGGEPSVSFGDDHAKNGVYTFTFEFNNLSGEEQVYVLDSVVLTDQFHEGFYELTGVKLMGESSRVLDSEVAFSAKSAVSYNDYNGDGVENLNDVQDFLDDVNSGAVVYQEKFDFVKDGVLNTADVQNMYENYRVAVPAYGTVSVNVTVTLSAADKAYMDANYPNGIYVEGFVRAYAENAESCDLSLPFLGFYGDWSQARVFDTYSWYHEGMELPERYASILWLDSTTGIGAGGNPYEGPLSRFDPNFEGELYQPVVSPNGDGSSDYVDDIYLSLMRNAKRIEFIWTDENGNVLLQRDADYARQSSYQSGYGGIVPFVYSWYFTDIYTFTDAEGNYLPDGSEVTLDINFYLDDGDWKIDDHTSATILVDSVYPTLNNIEYKYDETNNTRKLLVTVSDNNDVAAVAILTRMGSIVNMLKPTEKNSTVNADGSFTLEFDVTELDSEFVLVVGDYGGNERYFEVEFSEGTDHVRQDAFYGYRNLMNYQPGDGYIYLMDNYNGWYSFSATDAETMLMHTSMYEDNEALVVAADYVDGYVIAIDEDNNIFAMKAGDWTRIPVGVFEMGYPYNAGPVLDMAYDFKNDVMYVLTDEQYAGEGGILATIDLLTGEATALGRITMPEGHTGQLLTLACDNDGVLYAISYVAGAEAGNEDTGDLYTIDVANIVPGASFYAPASVPVKYVGETGYLPDYRQSMTVDHDSNELYWMAYASPYATDPATFFQVDKTTGELTVVSDVEYNSQMTAVYKPFTSCNAVFPAAELEMINLSTANIAMSAGSSAVLTVTPYPYYADLGEVVWTSSDESVAVVENGVVKAIGEGRAEITVTSGDITATCLVDIVDLTADLTFYEWANEMVWWSFNAAAPGDAVVLENTITPSSPYNGFMATAYYDGWLYMSESAGAFHRVDPETMQGSLLGSSQTTLFAMAFNYFDGFMYAIEQQQISMWESAYNLVRVNLSNGQIDRVCKFNNGLTPLGGMAIDHNGYFYSIVGDSMTGGLSLVQWVLMEDPFMGGMQMQFTNMISLELEGLYNFTSMVYSAEDEGLYFCDNMGQLIWVDLAAYNMGELRAVTVGAVGGELYSAMNMSLFTIPETEPETPDVPVESVTLSAKFMVLEGGSVAASASVEPWNAYPEVTYAIADTSIATVDSNGIVTGVAAGETTLTITVAGVAYEREVVVAESTGYLGGFVLDDFAGGGMVFAQFKDTNPTTDIQAFYGDDAFSVFSGAYFNGTLYAYGQDQWGDLGYYYYFFTIDPDTLEMTKIARVEYNLRDMAFDYTSGNLYAIAQGGTLVGAVVQIDMETGELTIIGDTGVTLAAMTIDANGQMYAIAEDDYLYAIDKKTGEATKIGHTGVDAAALYQSMHYDLDTGNTYWAQVAADQTSSLRLVDLETGVTSGLGSISPAGAMLTMMYTVPANEPTEPTGPVKEAGIVINEKATTHVGGTVQLDATILTEVELAPPSSSASTNGVGSTDGMTITWTSSDKSIATVDANGVVTGVKAGTVTITAQVGEYTDECVVTITEEARKYYAYDKSNKQWISFDGETLDNLGNLAVTTERKDAEGEALLMATFYVAETDTIYAMDEMGVLYSIDPDTFERTVTGVDLGTVYTTTVEEFDWVWNEYIEIDLDCETKVVDLSYDNGKLYALMIAENEDAWVQLSVIAEIDLEAGTYEYIYESGEIRGANLYVKNGRAFMVDAMMSGMIDYVDLYSAEQKLVQDVLIKQYWGDPWAGCALFEDTLTGVIYAIRDMTDTYGTIDYDTWETIPWDGVTGDSVLHILGLSDGSLVRIGEIGNNIVVRGMFIR